MPSRGAVILHRQGPRGGDRRATRSSGSPSYPNRNTLAGAASAPTNFNGAAASV